MKADFALFQSLTLLRRMLTIAPAVAAGLALPAQADLASFELAFTGLCFRSVPDLTDLPATFTAKGWQGYAGADHGEFEFYKDGTAVYLRAVKMDEGPGCTVSDPDLAPIQAQWILELALGKYFPGQWEAGTGYSGQPAWYLREAGTTTTFYVNNGMDGGAAISMEIRK
jgi:hypothetical protein